MQNRNIFGFANKEPLSLIEAHSIAGILKRITDKHSRRVDVVISKIEALDSFEKEKTKEFEDEINREIEEWNSKVHKLGGIPKGLWIVDLDAGDGYFSWKYPESEILYWHDYQSKYSERISLLKKEKLLEPCELP
ncbi:MAG: DUF2203 family protein [Bdellovibrionales bacterium]